MQDATLMLREWKVLVWWARRVGGAASASFCSSALKFALRLQCESFGALGRVTFGLIVF